MTDQTKIQADAAAEAPAKVAKAVADDRRDQRQRDRQGRQARPRRDRSPRRKRTDARRSTKSAVRQDPRNQGHPPPRTSATAARKPALPLPPRGFPT